MIAGFTPCKKPEHLPSNHFINGRPNYTHESTNAEAVGFVEISPRSSPHHTPWYALSIL
jgi:hypothetical protein